LAKHSEFLSRKKATEIASSNSSAETRNNSRNENDIPPLLSAAGINENLNDIEDFDMIAPKLNNFLWSYFSSHIKISSKLNLSPPEPSSFPQTSALFVDNGSNFDELISYIHEISDQFNINLVTISNLGMKDALIKYISEHNESSAFYIGTRSNDPYGSNSDFFKHSDPSWPCLMRVCPILNWSYCDVWSFIRSTNIPYCSLYDQGYTSLGDSDKTTPNSDLYTNGKYSPAWALLDSDHERNGRV
jgi:FAD synthetase